MSPLHRKEKRRASDSSRGAAFLCPDLFRDTAKKEGYTAVNASDCDVLCVSIV